MYTCQEPIISLADVVVMNPTFVQTDLDKEISEDIIILNEINKDIIIRNGQQKDNSMEQTDFGIKLEPFMASNDEVSVVNELQDQNKASLQANFGTKIESVEVPTTDIQHRPMSTSQKSKEKEAVTSNIPEGRPKRIRRKKEVIRP